MDAERHLRLVPGAAPVRAHDALLDLLADDRDAAARFERACRRFVIVPDGEVRALRSALARRGCHHTYGDVEAALYALALDEVPGSWAAGRERLRLLVRSRAADVPRTTASVIEDLANGEAMWLREMWLIAEDAPSYLRLREVSAKVWRELRRRGHDLPPEHFSEHVHEVLRSVFPDAPGAAWDHEWAGALASRAVARVSRTAPAYASDSAEVDRAHDEVVAAAEAEDCRRYRRALREWVATAN